MGIPRSDRNDGVGREFSRPVSLGYPHEFSAASDEVTSEGESPDRINFRESNPESLRENEQEAYQ
jgi:hypothetical protein